MYERKVSALGIRYDYDGGGGDDDDGTFIIVHGECLCGALEVDETQFSAVSRPPTCRSSILFASIQSSPREGEESAPITLHSM